MHRSYYNNSIFKNNAPLWGLFSKLLMEASFEPLAVFIHGANKIYPAGSLVTSAEELAKDWGISRQAMQKKLGCLKGCNLIAMDSCQRFTVITIVGYGLQEEKNSEVVTQVAAEVVTPVVTPVVTRTPETNAHGSFEFSNKKEEEENKKELHKALESEQKLLDEAEDKVSLSWLTKEWNAIVTSNEGTTMVTIRKILPNTDRLRMVESKNKKEWEEVLELVSSSKFLLGYVDPKEGKKRFSLTIDWIIKPANWNKVLERKYNPSNPQKGKKTGGGAVEFKSIFAGKGKSLAEFDAEYEAANREDFLEPEYVEDDSDERF